MREQNGTRRGPERAWGHARLFAAAGHEVIEVDRAVKKVNFLSFSCSYGALEKKKQPTRGATVGGGEVGKGGGWEERAGSIPRPADVVGWGLPPLPTVGRGQWGRRGGSGADGGHCRGGGGGRGGGVGWLAVAGSKKRWAQLPSGFEYVGPLQGPLEARRPVMAHVPQGLTPQAAVWIKRRRVASRGVISLGGG